MGFDLGILEVFSLFPHSSIQTLAIICTIWTISGCSGTRRTSSRAVTPPPLQNEEGTIPKQDVSKSETIDSTSKLLSQAKTHEVRGIKLLRTELIEEARKEFDIALQLLQEYSAEDPSNLDVQGDISLLHVHISNLDLLENNDTPGIENTERIESPPENSTSELGSPILSNIEDSVNDLPVEINDRVLSMLDHYTAGQGRSTIEVGLKRIGFYRPMIEKIFVEEGIPLGLIYLAQAESLFKPKAVSRSKAKGMWQFMSARGKEYGLRQNWWIDERLDPQKSTRAAARHLKDLYDQFGDWYLAMAAYNSGPNRVRRAINQTGDANFWTLADQRKLPKETRNYIPTILAMAIIGNHPGRYDFDVIPNKNIHVERVRIEKATDLRIIAKNLDLPLEMLQELNPHVLRWATPPQDSEFELNLPVGYRSRYFEKVAGLPEEKRILFRHHIVASGDTLSHIAVRYNVPIRVITTANNLSEKQIISIGQSIMIPISGLPIPEDTFTDFSLPNKVEATAPPLYRIKRGDTLLGIAKRYSLSVKDIRLWNEMSSTLLIAGHNLRLVPPLIEETNLKTTPKESTIKVVYLVKTGDTLTKIAKSYQTSVARILEWNQRFDLSTIRPGDLITIYTKR